MDSKFAVALIDVFCGQTTPKVKLDPANITLERAKRLGERAYNSYLSTDYNPFELGTPHSDQWLLGFREMSNLSDEGEF